MNTATFHSRLGILGLSMRRFAAMTGVQYETARHWGVVRHGHPQEFPRWVPLMLEMMDPSVSRKPPDKALLRPRPDAASHHPIVRQQRPDRQRRGHQSPASSSSPHGTNKIGSPVGRHNPTVTVDRQMRRVVCSATTRMMADIHLIGAERAVGVPSPICRPACCPPTPLRLGRLDARQTPSS